MPGNEADSAQSHTISNVIMTLLFPFLQYWKFSVCLDQKLKSIQNHPLLFPKQQMVNNLKLYKTYICYVFVYFFYQKNFHTYFRPHLHFLWSIFSSFPTESETAVCFSVDSLPLLVVATLSQQPPHSSLPSAHSLFSLVSPFFTLFYIVATVFFHFTVFSLCHSFP